jgi:hypothetical protein
MGIGRVVHEIPAPAYVPDVEGQWLQPLPQAREVDPQGPIAGVGALPRCTGKQLAFDHLSEILGQQLGQAVLDR